VKRLLLTACLALGATDLAAQRLATAPDYLAPGPFVLIGVGGGTVGSDCASCSDWSGGGLALRSAMGVRLSSRLALDVNFEGIEWTKESTVEHDVHITVGAQWRAWRMVSVRLGAGPSVIRQEVSTGSGTTVLEARHVGFVFGAAYELPVSRRLTVAPYFNARSFGSSALELQGSPIVSDYSTRSFDFGVSTTLSLRSFLWPNDRDKGPE